MEALECDVARSIRLVLFSVTDKRYTLCDVANDGWLDFDRLDVKLVTGRGRAEQHTPL